MDVKPWELYPHIWKTEAMYLSWIRGGIRRYLWSKNPVKLEFVKENRIQIPNPSKRKGAKPFIWGGRCEICKKFFPSPQMEVDHKTGEHSLKKVSDIQKFVEGIVFVSKEDLAFLCKPCHKIKTNAERKGLTQEESAIDKEAIRICKGKADVVKSWITKHGEVPERTVPLRKAQVLRMLTEGK
jgi:5-methylcytosine-specific restriction endonuclease McrA